MKSYDELLNENLELAATVLALRSAIMSNCYDDQSTSGQRLMELANKTPQQNLRDVKAEAVSKFCAELRESIMSVPVPEYGYYHNVKMRDVIVNVISSASNHYAESERSGDN